MEVYIDGKKVECKTAVRVVVPVECRDGIDSQSELGFTIHAEGVSADLLETTESSAPSAEETFSFWETHEEFIDEYMLNYKE